MRRGGVDARLIGACEVGHEAQVLQRDAAGEQLRTRLEHRLGPESEPVHAGVGFEPDDRWRVVSPACRETPEHRDLTGFMDDEIETGGERDDEFVVTAHTFEQEDRLLDAAVTQFHRLAEACHGESVRDAGQGLRHP